MAYVIAKFGAAYATGVALPTYDGSWPQGAGSVGSPLVQVPGGAYDPQGTERLPWGAVSLDLSGYLYGTSASDLQTKLDALRALLGTRSKLWATPDGGTTTRWRVARCLEMTSPRAPRQGFTAQVRMVFECLPGPWSGTARSVAAALDVSPKTVTVANSGNARVDNAVITITAAGSAITVVTVGVAGVSEIQWAGTLAVGDSLVIDCGARSVKNDGVAAYSGLTLTANHLVSEWLRLSPGNNSVVITRTGGDETSAATIAFADGWA